MKAQSVLEPILRQAQYKLNKKSIKRFFADDGLTQRKEKTKILERRYAPARISTYLN